MVFCVVRGVPRPFVRYFSIILGVSPPIDTVPIIEACCTGLDVGRLLFHWYFEKQTLSILHATQTTPG